MNRCWILCFLGIQQDDHVVFVFEFVYVVDYIDGFLYIEPFLHPWDDSSHIQPPNPDVKVDPRKCLLMEA